MKKYALGVLGTIFAAALFMVMPQAASATVTWNNWQADCPTVMVANHQTQQGYSNPCWSTSPISATNGQSVNVRIYYHNTGNTPTTNTYVYVQNASGTSSNFTLSGGIAGGPASSVQVSLDNPSTLSLSQVKWYPNKSQTPYALPNGQSGAEVLSGGLNLGSIAPATSCPTTDQYCYSGSVVVSFIVHNTQTQTAQCSISSFSANPTLVQSGNPSVLSWITSNCASVSISGLGSQQLAGSVSTGPLTQSTTYTLTAVASNGQTQHQTATVSVQQTAACDITSFSANPTVVQSGYSSVLSWITSNCTSVSISGLGSQQLSGSTPTGAISGTTTYVLTATGANGQTQSRSATVTVQQASTTCSINSFVASPSNVISGSSSTLSWATNGCTIVTISGISGTQTAPSGSVSTGTLYGTNTYILTATGANGSTDSRSVTVTVSNASTCSVDSFYASPSYVQQGSSTTLYWNTSNCSNVVVQGPGVYSYSNSGSTTTGAIYGSNTYTITANSNNGGTVTRSLTVSSNQTQQCYINNFYASPNSVSSGQSTTLYWSVNGGGSVVVSGPGVYSTLTSGSVTTSPLYSSGTYTITANCSNAVTQSVFVTVQNQQSGTVTPVTTLATNVGTTSARLNGFIQSIGNQTSTVSAFFEYGTTASLGSTTGLQTMTTATLSNYFATIGTSPATTYYYRAAAIGSDGNIYHGSIVSFTTAGNTVSTGGGTRIIYVSTGGTSGIGNGSSLIMLSITDQYQSVMPGDAVTYTVTYKNISNKVLSNAVLNVMLPTGVTFKQSTLGVLTTSNTVVASLGTLPVNAEGMMTIQAVVNDNVLAGSNLIATATLSFSMPTGTQDSAIAYDVDTVSSRSTLAGLALFGGGFFPGTFLGWIILLAIILLIILLARYLYGHGRPAYVAPYHTTVYQGQPAPQTPNPQVNNYYPPQPPQYPPHNNYPTNLPR